MQGSRKMSARQFYTQPRKTLRKIHWPEGPDIGVEFFHEQRLFKFIDLGSCLTLDPMVRCSTVYFLVLSSTCELHQTKSQCVVMALWSFCHAAGINPTIFTARCSNSPATKIVKTSRPFWVDLSSIKLVPNLLE